MPDSTLDELVSSIVVEREQIGPNRYIADLGILFDRARSAELLGVGGDVRRSVPMLLVPVLISGGAETTVEIRNPWQRAWAEFRTSQSPIDYVRVSGQGIDPLLVNEAEVDRPGRGWWRNLIDLYGAADILVAQVQFQRLYPGGPAFARFVGYHGPDKQLVGSFTISAPAGASALQVMRAGRSAHGPHLSRMRWPTAGWFATGASTSLSRRLRRKSSRKLPWRRRVGHGPIRCRSSHPT